MDDLPALAARRPVLFHPPAPALDGGPARLATGHGQAMARSG
ncbi:MAG: hypothetical protein ACLGI3_03935 [Actinomycetes bacterium]